MDFNNLSLGNVSQTNNNADRTILIGNKLMNKVSIPNTERSLVTFNGTNGTFPLNAEDLSKGLLICGSPGSGKTNTFFIILDSVMPKLCKDDIMIIFDSKHDFKSRYYNRQNHNHIVISASEEDKYSARAWNIFDELRNDQGGFDERSELVAKEISKALFKDLESSSQPFFNISASDLFTVLVMMFVKEAVNSNDFSRLTNENLVKFIKFSTVQDYYSITEKYKEYKYIQSYLGNPKAPTAQALGILGFLNSMVSNCFVGSFGRKMPAGEFSIRKLMRNKGGKVVFMEYDMLLGDTLSPDYSLLYDLAIKEALKEGKGNTYIVCDELNLLNCERLQEAVNIGRGRGLKTIVGIQNINQLFDNYGEEKGRAIAAGFVNAFCFKAVDSDTRQFVSDRFGKTFESINWAGSNLTRDGHTVEDNDIHNLKIGEAFVDIGDYPPFKYKFNEVS